MNIPAQPESMPAGRYPAHVEAACLVCEVKPAELLAWSVRNDAVTLVLPTGQKVSFLIEGKWQGQQLVLPLKEAPAPGPGSPVGPKTASKKR